jgi:hypothetical protein
MQFSWPICLRCSRAAIRPDWVVHLRTADELKAHAAITTASAEIEARKAAIAEHQSKIASANLPKELFFSTGEQFQNAVASALEELGIKVVNGPRARADIIGFDGTTVLAIEAKGIEGSARETHLRQVDTWKAEVQHTVAATSSERRQHPILSAYGDQLEKVGVLLDPDGGEIDCKGIMVLGTYRSTPLPDRNQDDFPAAVVSKIKLSRVCALTGLQLYNLLIQARNDAEAKITIKTALFVTEGVLPIGKDWQTHLTNVN